MKYKSLNDAARNPEVEARHREMLTPPAANKGSIEVWYAKEPTFMADGVFQPNQSHAKLGEVAYRHDWQTLYGPLQGDFWSPKGEARDFILGLGLRHTSMSVGDVLFVKPPSGRSEAWQVSERGWRLIK